MITKQEIDCMIWIDDDAKPLKKWEGKPIDEVEPIIKPDGLTPASLDFFRRMPAGQWLTLPGWAEHRGYTVECTRNHLIALWRAGHLQSRFVRSGKTRWKEWARK
jgi:hypothetical protein